MALLFNKFTLTNFVKPKKNHLLTIGAVETSTESSNRKNILLVNEKGRCRDG